MATIYLLMLGLVGAAWLYAEWAQKQIKKEMAEFTPKAPVITPDSRWFALPPDRLELADTGFYVTLVPNDKEGQYHGYTPEGHFVARGYLLAAMKKLLEQLADERAEFMRGRTAEEHKP